MICLACAHYIPTGRVRPISPACTWTPTAAQAEVLTAMLPAPVMSRLLVQPSPVDVAECAAYSPAL